jgi:hypothetical protein
MVINYGDKLSLILNYANGEQRTQCGIGYLILRLRVIDWLTLFNASSDVDRCWEINSFLLIGII